MKFAPKLILSTLVLSSLLASFNACTKKQTKVDEATAQGILLKGNGAEPQDLDPQIVTGVPEGHILAALFEGLVAEDPKDLSPTPGVAESWTISPDGLTYTFKIRANAKWSNGEALTAKDFEYSWQRILSPGLGSEYAYMLHYVKNAKPFNEGKIKDFSQVGVKATDASTLVVTLENATPFFLGILQHHSTLPVHKATIEKFGKMDQRGTKWTRPENMVSNGAFVLKQWELNKIIAVEKNPQYWDAAQVKLNGIHFFPIDSQQTEERDFRAGQLHVTNEVPINKIAVYREKEPNLMRIDPYLGTYFYRINVTKKPMDDKRVRKALALSIDRQMIVEKVKKGGELPAFSYTPPGTAGFTAKATHKLDVAEAKKLLAEAGYPDGKNFPSTELLYNTHEAHKVIAEAVQQMWKTNLGINIQLTNQDWKVYLDSQRKLNYQLSRSAWIGDYNDPNTFLDMFVTGGGNNNTGWSNKDYDQAIADAAKTTDREKRFAAFQRAEEILVDETPIIPVYTYTRPFLISPDVKGWYPTIQDHHPYKFVSLESQKK